MRKAERVEIKSHPTSGSHKIALVESRRGLCYAITCAEPYPSEADVRRLWREERSAFMPYDESTGQYRSLDGGGVGDAEWEFPLQAVTRQNGWPV